MNRLEKINEQVLNSIVQTINTVIILHDRRLKVVFVNDTFEKVFEISRDDALGRSPMEFLPEFDRRHKSAIIKRLKDTLKTGTKSNYHEFAYYSPKGTYRFLSAVSLPVLSQDGQISHVMSLINDQTRQKELEMGLLNAAKLSSVADMAYTLAHEINNPLTGIKLGLATLYESLKKPKNIQVLDSVMKDLSRIQKTVHSFLQKRKEQPFLKKERIKIIEEIIDEAFFHLGAQLELQGIAAEKNLDGNDGHLLIDRDRIYQVVLNVLLNAIQAIPAEGRIVISSQITIPASSPAAGQPYLCIAITDSGPGLDPNLAHDPFQPYISLKPGGTGLGLSICKDIVSAHKGFIQVRSELGQGTTINIHLPLSSE